MENKGKLVGTVWFIIMMVLCMNYCSQASAQIASGANNTPNRVRVCQKRLASMVNSSSMSSTTARRVAYKLCKKLRDGTTEERYFFRALVR